MLGPVRIGPVRKNQRSAQKLNHSGIWQVLLVLTAILLGLLYALPNLYGEDPALQISGIRGHSIDQELQSKVDALLSKQQIATKGVSKRVSEQILLRFSNAEVQRAAKDLLAETLGDNYIVALALAPTQPRWLSLLGAEPLKLGLDLRGGVHFLLEVDSESVIQQRLERLMGDLRAELKANDLGGLRSELLNSTTVALQIADQTQAELAKKLLATSHPELTFELQNKNKLLLARFSEQQLRNLREQMVEQNSTILRKRVAQLGVTEPVIQRQGANRIVVELPGVQDTAQAKMVLGSTAMLEFRLQNSKIDLNQKGHVALPVDNELYYNRYGKKFALFRKVILSGDHIVDAHASMNEYGASQVNITLDSEGGRQMAKFSKSHIGQPLATLFTEYREESREEVPAPGNLPQTTAAKLKKQSEVITSAYIESQLGSHFRITGIGSMADARNLALLLRAGSLVAPLQIVEERTIGPSLGQHNVDRGIKACIWGLAATAAFMTIYYKIFGVIASAALVANLVMLLGALALFPGATLTLPGIAGIVLTIGMAVDANVLIFERIKEELRSGRKVQQAISNGYSNAFSTIADANITTLLTAIILYAVGTGPIKGFAITLSIGLATSMFSAIVGTRTVVNLLYGAKATDAKSVNKLSI